MRKIFKLLMSVAAVAGTLACTTDATEDLSVKVGGKTQLTLSFDDTRTEIGTKDNGVYPLTWSENDQVSVNGIASDKLTVAEGAGTANATFSFGGELTTPYCVAFPAAAAGQVMFAAVQNHTSNTTFDSKAAVMYGYSKNGENIKLKHLTGILKFSIAATDEMVDINEMTKLSQVRISTIDRKPIAGAFGIDFTTGELTPTNESTNTIVYNMDNYRLAPSASVDVHIAVPAGTYDELYVTIEDSNGNVNYATVKADTKAPLTAGNVREFATPIVFEPIDTNEVFVIKDYDSLVAFAEEAAKSTADTPITKDAVFVADVQIPDTGWATVKAQYYTGTINGNGFAINGLNKTLFGVLGAEEIKGLHLTNVNISGTQSIASASGGKSIAAMIAEYRGISISHCSVSGSLTVTGITGARRIGAIVGTLVSTGRDVEFNYCVNNATITAERSDTNSSNTSSIGGILGMTSEDCDKTLSFKGCTNNGAVILDGKTTSPNRLSGICGYLSNFKTITFEDCSNNGKVVLNMNARQKSARLVNVGGIFGESSTSDIKMANCYNRGIVTCGSPNINRGLRLGGLIGRQNGNNLTIDNCGNSGEVSTNIDACTPDHEFEDPRSVANMIGGIIGIHNIKENGVVSSITNITIENGAKLACYGYNVLTNSAGNSSTPCTKNDFTLVYAGGVIGLLSVTDGITPDVTYNNWTNRGSMEILIGNEGLNDASSYFGGVAGYLDGVTVSNVQCYTTIKAYWTKADASKVSLTNVGMLTGNTGATFTDSSVSGSYEDAASVTTLNADNYFKYLFSDRTLASYAGVTLAE